jgi:peptidoglycan/LPS O-acetylase OafA/YrhL
MLYIAASFLFVRNVFEVATGANNLTAHYWSLAVEEQFYLIFPAILKKSLRTYLYFLFLVLAICFVSGLAGSNVLAKMTDNTYVEGAITIISEFQGIAIGSLFSILIFKGKLTDLHKGGGYKMPAFIILVVLLSLYTGNYFAIFSFFKCICIAMIIVIGLHYDDNIFFKILNHKTLKFIGVLSFSIYIWQQPFTLGLSFINQSTFINRFNNKMMADVVILVILLATLGVISYLSYHFYEKRFLALKNKFKNKG